MQELDSLAPVVVFTYNRLDHTRKTVSALQRNKLAEATELFIYSDAPKNEAAQDSVAEVRNYLHGVAGFKSVKIIEREENWGLARNIIDGVTKIVNEYGKIIVLEDDIVTSKYFLQYMNEGLKLYQDKLQVMAVSGYSYIENDVDRKEAYFLPFTSCWGWGTWQRVWKEFNRNPDELIATYTPEKVRRFNLDGAYDFWSQVRKNADGTLFTWAVFFYELVFRNQGLCLYPPKTLVNNVGFDSSGEHCGKDTKGELTYIGEICEISQFPKDIITNQKLLYDVKMRFIKLKPTFGERMIHSLSKVLSKIFQ